jgi:NADPH-dependent curcumin reductase CurA
MKQIVLRSRPVGSPVPEDFALADAPVPIIGEGQLLLRTLWLSVDPFMRLMLDAKPFGMAPEMAVPLDGPMPGSIVAQVVETRSDSYAVGDLVEVRARWAEYVTVDAATPGLRKLNLPADVAPSVALGALGMPGQTAYAGLVNVARLKAGETVVISAAAGAVGTTAGQIARIIGARVIGIAGGAQKCAALRAIGFDECLDYRDPVFAQNLAAAAPEGVDVYFENVGGAVTRAVVPLMKYGGRIPMCGFISQYGDGEESAGPDQLPWLMRMMMYKGLEMRGYSGPLLAGAEGLAMLGQWVAEGKLRPIETCVEGLENAPVAFAGIFQPNATIGKLVVKVADPFTRQG